MNDLDNLDNLDLDSIDNQLKSINLELGNQDDGGGGGGGRGNHSQLDNTDMELDLLTNKSKKRSSSSSGFNVNNSDHSISINKFDSPKPESVSHNEILDDRFFEDNLENINLDNIDANYNGMSGPTLPDLSSHENMNDNFETTKNYDNNNASNIPSSKPMSYEEIQRAKFDLLCKFERL